MILEFPAFVLVGVYSPATRDDTRTDFRLGFLEALDARVRNLVAMGKQVVLAGDLNIIRSEIDTAGAKEMLRKEDMTVDEFMSMPSRRFLNQLLFDGRVVGDTDELTKTEDAKKSRAGERDEGRERPVLWDLCRLFHPDRLGMYTCWETKKNARPGNYGSRIDYVLCSDGIKDWFSDADIQEGLLGSDHCPVYATLRETVHVDKTNPGGTQTVHVIDKMNPEGMFVNGRRVREWSAKLLLPTSAKLIPEFDRRRSIRDMFKSASKEPSKDKAANKEEPDVPEKAYEAPTLGVPEIKETDSAGEHNPQTLPLISAPDQASARVQTFPPPTPTASESSSYAGESPAKRPAPSQASQRPQKKNKAALKREPSKGPSKSQSSLMGFFKPKTTASTSDDKTPTTAPASTSDLKQTDGADDRSPPPPTEPPSPRKQSVPTPPRFLPKKPADDIEDDIEAWDAEPEEPSTDKVHDPIVAKESWSKLLGKRVPPMCEHNEPCISLVTKKPGVNCGMSSPVPP